MTDTRDGLAGHDRVYLEKLRLATQVLLAASEEESAFLNDVIESELVLVRDEIERALLLGPCIQQPT